MDKREENYKRGVKRDKWEETTRGERKGMKGKKTTR